MTTPFSREQTRQHETATFAMLPWVGRLFDHGPLLGASTSLPLDDPEALTTECLERVDQIVRRATWKYLAHTCGWKRLAVLGRSQPVRLWEIDVPQLSFSEWTMSFLLQLFNATQAERNFNRALLRYDGTDNGDLIVHHLAFRRLAESPALFGAARAYPLEFWYDNPLNRGWHYRCCERRPEAAANWDLLFANNLHPFLPWILQDWTSAWQVSAERRWDEDGLESWNQNHGLVCRELIGLLERHERPDLLGFLLRFFIHHARNATTDRDRFDSWSARRSHRTRRERTAPWADYLAIPLELRKIYRGLITLHPVERNEPQKLLMALYQSLEFDQAVDRLTALRTHLQPAIS